MQNVPRIDKHMLHFIQTSNSYIITYSYKYWILIAKFRLNKNHITLLFSDICCKNKANLDYKTKITIYVYLLCNKLIHNYLSYSYLLLLSSLFYHKPMVYETLKILSIAYELHKALIE